ncbi:uncharacterized protein LOC128885358 [Hylaeus anthracinus]|uniref:uncharacterized protein LOC128885358 n=1 Tax=Hylaeus anthracinus TaxID=313031 RepID=UPI0023B92052|nr:uncharacterized protein LOC128885358 [Hylaeus anthracinus]
MSSTETADEIDTNDFTLGPPNKRIKKTHLSVEEKQLILNIYKSLIQENSTMLITDIVQKAATIAGVCKSTVYRVLREYKRTRTLSIPKEKRTYDRTIDAIDDLDKNAIRRKVHEFYLKNEIPTADKVLKVVNDDNDVPNVNRTILYKLLKILNFQHARRGRSSMLFDREEIVVWRREYLRKIKTYRNDGRKIYYLDETWINADRTRQHVVKVETISPSMQATSSGLYTGVKNSSSTGKRLIVCHIGSRDGFVPGGMWAFESKMSGDFQEEITHDSFENWFLKILPKLEKHSVIVLDDAHYHCRKVEKIPTTATKIETIKSWLVSKNIQFDENLLKAELLAIVNTLRSKYDAYVIDELARRSGKTVLRLPPYHCELNPIELIWTEIKSYVASYSNTAKFNDIQHLVVEAANSISLKKWKHAVQHVEEKVETMMWELDNIIENNTEPIIININEDSSSSDYSD